MKPDIEKEIERYKKYNYTKNDVIEHLKRDGFTDEEIFASIETKFTSVDGFAKNPICFFFTILHLFAFIGYSISVFFSNEEVLLRFVFLLLTGVLIWITYAYFSSRKFSYIVSIALITLFAIFGLYYCLSNFFQWKMPFKITTLLVYLYIYKVILLGNYDIYTKQKDE
jgi:hypothetical protein